MDLLLNWLENACSAQIMNFVLDFGQIFDKVCRDIDQKKLQTRK